MNEYEKIYNKLKQQYSDEEIAEGYMIPATLSQAELKESESKLLAFRMERLGNRTEKQRLISELTRLRVSIQIYLKLDHFHEAHSFGKVLSQYISILQKTKKEFAKAIDMHPSQLSRILNEKEEPNHSLIYRLEKHSDKIIPALFWWKLMMRKQAHFIEHDTIRRKIEGDRVNNPLKFSA